jgi:hypothetical protein
MPSDLSRIRSHLKGLRPGSDPVMLHLLATLMLEELEETRQELRLAEKQQDVLVSTQIRYLDPDL